MINQMNIFVVPTGFSGAAKNAAIFAAQAAASVQGAEVILYYLFDNYLAGSDGTPMADEPAARKRIAELALQHVKEAMLEAAGAVNVIYIATEEGSFRASLDRKSQVSGVRYQVSGIRYQEETKKRSTVICFKAEGFT